MFINVKANTETCGAFSRTDKSINVLLARRLKHLVCEIFFNIAMSKMEVGLPMKVVIDSKKSLSKKF